MCVALFVGFRLVWGFLFLFRGFVLRRVFLC